MTLSTKSLKTTLTSPAVIVGAAFALRMGVLLYMNHTTPLPRASAAPFGYEMGSVACSIAGGRGFSSPLRIETGPTAWFTPVYPYLLAAVFKVFGIYTQASYQAILILNGAFSALTCYPIFWIGRRVFGPALGASAAWLWCILPSAVFLPLIWVWDTSLSALLLALAVWATPLMLDCTSIRYWVGYGALWALCVLTNPACVSLLPFVLCWLIFRMKKHRALWPRLTGATVLMFMVGISPWVVRNYLVFGRIVLFRSNFGLELYLGNNPQVPDSWSWWLHPNDNDQEREKYRQLGEIEYMAQKKEESLRFIVSHPQDVARFVFHRFINNWIGAWDPIADVWRFAPWRMKANYLSNCAFTVLALLGLLFSFRTREPEAFLFAIVIFIFPVVYYVTHTALRYRHPIDPVMAVLAAYAPAFIVAKCSEKLALRAGVPATRRTAAE